MASSSWFGQGKSKKKGNEKGKGCPFEGGEGYSTAQGRQDWINAHNLSNKSSEIPTSFIADLDPSAPLYYWQIHSLLGPKRIEDIITSFYHKIYADNEDHEFRNAFARISEVEHHIYTQTSFWIDVFGGGRSYHGGDYRLNFHHEHNAHSVMNAAGAKRWMYHMNLTLCELDFSQIDIRIKPCIIDFLQTKMKKYAKLHHWKYDEKDFDYIFKNDPEMIQILHNKWNNLTYNKVLKLNIKELKEFLIFRKVNSMELCIEKLDLLNLAYNELKIIFQNYLLELNSFNMKNLIHFLNQFDIDSSQCVEKNEMIILAQVMLQKNIDAIDQVLLQQRSVHSPEDSLDILTPISVVNDDNIAAAANDL